MKNRPGSNSVVSDWEIAFDADDPDFCIVPPPLNALDANAPTIIVGADDEEIVNEMQKFTFKVPSANNMSLASVHGPQFTDICSPLGRNSMSSSLSDLVGSPFEIAVENFLTIEELRTHMGSCFTCGVSWTDEHISLDCAECGGYSVERPCPLCDGQCGVQWKRDFTMSHACGKARWQGVCPSYPEAAMHLNPLSSNIPNTATASSTQASCAAASSNQLRLAQELCARLEQLSASAHT